MAQFRRTRSPLNSTVIVRFVAITIGLVFLALALRFAMEMPDVMPGNAAGILVLVFVGAVLVLGALWIGI
ncbi:hypothetical protein [Acetobacter fallax]|uniref:Uncharacterized protein n=1 Tax=Acetobacter fallax TaxID=1737473 RepID=A0ABX0K5W4_9PROT|nr:hypothetical protein [Acetobacter fallax]NHO31223.1 hypothetical protein [Acetobacter fallax]NHO34780.1 hypothetical protein [Acetobacter fallax]